MPKTPKTPKQLRLQTLHESDFEDQHLNFGIIQTTNVSHSHDSEVYRVEAEDAEQNFQSMMDHASEKEDSQHGPAELRPTNTQTRTAVGANPEATPSDLELG